MAVNRFLLIAHRGGAKEAFENSPAAFRHAVKCGAGSIEADLRATRDGKIVILHDAGLKRVTTGDGKLKNFTFNQIRHVKLKNRELGIGPFSELPSEADF